MRSDVRYAVRLFTKAPGWTAVAVASLSLGIAVDLLIFSIVDAVLLRPFPYKDPSQLVFVWGTKMIPFGAESPAWISQTGRRAIARSVNRCLPGANAVLMGRPGETLSGACVGPAVLPMLGVQPALGRSFAAADAQPGADPVAIVSDGFSARTRTAAVRALIGSTLRLNGRSYEVIGVTPQDFFFPDTNTRLLRSRPPCGAANFFERGGAFAHAIGRLRPGVSVQLRAQLDLDSVNRQGSSLGPASTRIRIGTSRPACSLSRHRRR